MSEIEVNDKSNEIKTVPKIFFDEHRNTPLHYAAARKDKDNLLSEISKNYRIDFANDIGWTPLMIAARYGHLDIVNILLEHGADGTKCNRYGVSVFLMSVSSGNIEVLNVILNHLLNGGVSIQSMESILSPISIAVLFNYEHIASYLIEKSFDINAVSIQTGIPPVMYAAILENLVMVQFLLTNGADINLKNLHGKSAADIIQCTQNKTPTTPIYNYNYQYGHQPTFLSVNTNAAGKLRKSSNTLTPVYIISPQVSPIPSSPQYFFPSNFPHTMLAPTFQNYNGYSNGQNNCDDVYLLNETFNITGLTNQTYILAHPTIMSLNTEPIHSTNGYAN